jgi:hypothetical protein
MNFPAGDTPKPIYINRGHDAGNWRKVGIYPILCGFKGLRGSGPGRAGSATETASLTLVRGTKKDKRESHRRETTPKGLTCCGIPNKF